MDLLLGAPAVQGVGVALEGLDAHGLHCIDVLWKNGNVTEALILADLGMKVYILFVHQVADDRPCILGGKLRERDPLHFTDLRARGMAEKNAEGLFRTLLKTSPGWSMSISLMYGTRSFFRM